MVRRLTLTSERGERVTARLAMPSDPKPVGVVLAHGAGAGQDHPWITTMRDLLAAHGHPTLTFDYAYTAAGRRSPDRAERLLDVHAAAVTRMETYVPRVVLAGKSMGGRMASHLVADDGVAAAGLVYYGYPLVAVGKTEPRSTEHLRRTRTPQLFFAGTRDRLGPVSLVADVVEDLTAAELVVVPDGDHSFKVPKRTGRTTDEILDELATTTAAWIGRVG